MMRLSNRCTILLLGCLLVLKMPFSHAQTARYISDELEVPMRAGTSTRFKILRMLPSGTPLTLLDSDAASGYSRVRTEGGSEGFILTRYLMEEPSARNQLEAALTSVQPLQEENEQLKQQLAELSTSQQRLADEYEKLRNTNQRLNQDLVQIRKTASNALAIDERNKVLESQAVELERSLQIVQQENQALRDTANQTWFLYGAGVILCGILVGLILPKLRLRRHNRWGEL